MHERSPIDPVYAAARRRQIVEQIQGQHHLPAEAPHLQSDRVLTRGSFVEILPEYRAAALQAASFSKPDMIGEAPLLENNGDVYLPTARAEVVVNLTRKALQVKGQEIDMHPKEFLLLVAVAAAQGKTVSYDDLINLIWEGSPPRTARQTLHKHAATIRSLVESKKRGASQGFMQMVDRVGFRMSQIDVSEQQSPALDESS